MADGPLPRTALVRDGRLVAVGGVPVDELARRFGTPLWVLDGEDVEARAAAWVDAFGAGRVLYAAKALSVVGVLQLVARCGLGVDVMSAGELLAAERAGADPAGIVLHGVHKLDAEIDAAVRLGVGRVVVDAAEEVPRLAAAARRGPAPLPVLLRVNPAVPADTHPHLATATGASKFGLPVADGTAAGVAAAVLAEPSLRLVGLHFHVGSQLASAAPHTAAADVALALARQLADRHGAALRELDVGGGLGVPYADGDAVPSVADFAAAVRRGVEQSAARHRVPVPELLVEPGRSVVGPAGVTLYRVGATKHRAGGRPPVLVVDGGMSDNPRPALYGARHPILAAGTPRARGRARPVDHEVVGRHCETGDSFGVVALPGDVAPGDLVAAAVTGAYTHSLASNYNRFARPPMVLVARGRAEVLVRRETVEDLLARDVPLATPSAVP